MCLETARRDWRCGGPFALIPGIGYEINRVFSL